MTATNDRGLLTRGTLTHTWYIHKHVYTQKTHLYTHAHTAHTTHTTHSTQQHHIDSRNGHTIHRHDYYFSDTRVYATVVHT